MDDETSSDLPKCLPDDQMDTDEGPLINENSNGLSHLLTEGEFNSVDAGVDESSTSNQGFLNAVELSASSVGDYLESNTGGFNADSFDVGDNAVTFPSDNLNNVISDGDSRLSDSMYKMTASDTDGDYVEVKSKPGTEFEQESASEMSNDAGLSIQSSDTVQDALQKVTDSAGDNKKLSATEKENSKLLSEGLKVNNDSSDKFEPIRKKTLKLPTDKIEIKGISDVSSLTKVLKGDEINEVTEKSDEVTKHMEKLSNRNSDSIKVPVESQDTSNHLEEIEKLSTTSPGETKEAEESMDTSEGAVKRVKKEPVDEEIPGANQEIAKESYSMIEISIKREIVKHEPTERDESKEALQTPDIKVNVKDEVRKVGGAEETEVVSEDELPAVQKPSVKDAENVSDDELPGPKPAELPADTEVVSEDELPSAKKEIKESRKRKTDETRDGYDPGSPTSESELNSKKQAVAKNGECKPVPAEKRSSTDEKPKKKVLPELDKYWKVVNDDPTDFTGWTYLLQYVDQESDVEAAREAYDAFLSHYPYCYGYWRKYADYEKRKGSKKKCLEVLERGLKAIPLSVDLWIHYLNHIKATRTEDHAYLRSQYERAIEACGLEFRSDRLWESYIKWEAENGSALNVTNIYDRLLATPTLGYTSHFDNFQEHVMSEPVSGVVSRAELVRLRGEVRDATGSTPTLDLPPGEDEPLDHIASEEEAQAIKERVIAARRKVHKTTGEEVAARWTFEEGIKRPYFHVKPLERCQLKNWKAYLEWEKQNGSFKRALVLHERCLIACALYEEFWMRLIKFLEERSQADPSLVLVEREVLERACTVHHLDKPELHLYWAHFEEEHGHPARAADILDRVEKSCPGLVQIQYRRVNLERRRGDFEKCCQLYEGYIASAKSKAISSALAIKYARFLFHVKKEPPTARKVLDEAVTKDPLNARLHMQRLDLALHTPDTSFEVLEELVQSYEREEGAELETCAALAGRRRELAEELGTAAAARRAQQHARVLAKHLRKRARKDKHDATPACSASAEAVKKKEPNAAASNNTASATNSAYYQQPAAQSYDQSYAQPYQPPWGYQQPPGPYQHHPGPWNPYPNYY